MFSALLQNFTELPRSGVSILHSWSLKLTGYRSDIVTKYEHSTFGYNWIFETWILYLYHIIEQYTENQISI